MQIECRISSLLEYFAEMKLILSKRKGKKNLFMPREAFIKRSSALKQYFRRYSKLQQVGRLNKFNTLTQIRKQKQKSYMYNKVNYKYGREK